MHGVGHSGQVMVYARRWKCIYEIWESYGGLVFIDQDITDSSDQVTHKEIP